MTKLGDIKAGEKLTEIPDPVIEMDSKESEYFWLICQLLKDRDNLTGTTATTARILAEDIATMEDPEFAKVWTHGKAGEWVKTLAKKLDLSLEKIAEIEKKNSIKSIDNLAQGIGLSLYDLKQAGLPINE